MKLYIDDDSVDGLLVKLLRPAGHDVAIPHDLSKDGAHDADHFLTAIGDGRVILTHNYDDFEWLHKLVLAVGGHHPGLCIVRKDNDPKRDMDQRQIVRALRKFASAGVAAADGYHILNNYR